MSCHDYKMTPEIQTLLPDEVNELPQEEPSEVEEVPASTDEQLSVLTQMVRDVSEKIDEVAGNLHDVHEIVLSHQDQAGFDLGYDLTGDSEE